MAHDDDQERSTAGAAAAIDFVGAPASTAATGGRVEGERIRVLLSHTASENALAALFAAAGAIALRGAIDVGTLLAWGLAVALTILARELLRRAHARSASDIRDSRHPSWAWRLRVCAAASGSLWGALFLLTLGAADPPLGAVATLIALQVGYVALASGLHAAHVPAFLAFAIPSTGAALALAASIPDPALARQAMLLLVVTAIASMLCARRNADSLIASIARGFEHEENAVRLATERDRAELATLAKNRFLAAASHDLRQPLHAIGLYAGWLSKRLEGRDTDRVLDKMQRSIGGLTALFDGILDVSRLDADAMPNAPRAVPLAPLLRRLESEHEMQAWAKGLTLSIETDTGLAAHVDPTLLERVLINLIGNAIKFTETGEITVTTSEADGRLALSVRDTGCGIAEADREHVFSEYRQLRRDDRAGSGGRGLGLAIVRRLCDLMGGSIALRSTPGRGSEFTVSVPRAAVVEDDDVSMADRARLPDAPLWCARALVIDHEQTVLDATRRTLAHLGTRAVTARSVAEALRRQSAACGDEAPDVLIVDVGLRGGDSSGLEAVRSIRDAYDSEIPALLTTADSTCRYVAGKPAARVRLLHKPSPPHRLRAELTRLGERCARRRPVPVPSA